MQNGQKQSCPPGAAEFPVGFWNYKPVLDEEPSAAGDWADVGATVTMGPEVGPEPAGRKRMLAILDGAAERGVRVIVCDRRGYWGSLLKSDEKSFRREFAGAVKDFGKHPAVCGFHVGDEPGTGEFAAACRAIRIQKELAPGLEPHHNLLPWHPGCEGRVGFESWSAYLDAYVRESGTGILAYDCYSQMNPNPAAEPWGLDMYFRNLREYGEAGRRHRLPVWVTGLSVGHFRYRCPKEDDLRWQLYTALAHGAQGIFWFFLYMRKPHDNYRVAPIDEHGERTETFQWLSRVNRTFLKGSAAVVRKLALEKVSHVGTAWGGVALFDGAGLVSRAKSRHNTPLIVSEFKHADGGDYVAVVNNSQTDSCQAELWVRGAKPDLHRVGWMAEEQKVSAGDGWQAASGDDFVKITPWLHPGQMELYRVVNGRKG
jgi:hypothetical protein